MNDTLAVSARGAGRPARTGSTTSARLSSAATARPTGWRSSTFRRLLPLERPRRSARSCRRSSALALDGRDPRRELKLEFVQVRELTRHVRLQIEAGGRLPTSSASSKTWPAASTRTSASVHDVYYPAAAPLLDGLRNGRPLEEAARAALTRRLSRAAAVPGAPLRPSGAAPRRRAARRSCGQPRQIRRRGRKDPVRQLDEHDGSLALVGGHGEAPGRQRHGQLARPHGNPRAARAPRGFERPVDEVRGAGVQSRPRLAGEDLAAARLPDDQVAAGASAWRRSRPRPRRRSRRTPWTPKLSRDTRSPSPRRDRP